MNPTLAQVLAELRQLAAENDHKAAVMCTRNTLRASIRQLAASASTKLAGQSLETSLANLQELAVVQARLERPRDAEEGKAALNAAASEFASFAADRIEAEGLEMPGERLRSWFLQTVRSQVSHPNPLASIADAIETMSVRVADAMAVAEALAGAKQ